MGTGEGITQLDQFEPERIASQILGMGDIIGLVNEIEEKIDKEKALKAMNKFKKGEDFDLEDYADQLKQMQNMGGMQNLLSKMPPLLLLQPKECCPKQTTFFLLW